MKYLLIFFSVFAFAQQPNEMVSFSQAATYGLYLKPGQANVTSLQCMTKFEALTKYRLSTQQFSAYATNQLVPRANWWPDCTVKVNATAYKTFMCHNLGADESLDPHVAVQGIHGNYYRWGSGVAVATTSTPPGAIAGWVTTNAPSGSWIDGAKTANDPCPAGFRVTSHADWINVKANNTFSSSGPFGESATNFGCAAHFSTSYDSRALTLPIAGVRSGSNGELTSRGSTGWYTSSTENDSNNTFFVQIFSGAFNNQFTSKSSGMSLRCISQ